MSKLCLTRLATITSYVKNRGAAKRRKAVIKRIRNGENNLKRAFDAERIPPFLRARWLHEADFENEVADALAQQRPLPNEPPTEKE